MVNGGTIQSWTCLNLSRAQTGDAHRFCGDLVGMCNNIGMVLAYSVLSII